MPITKLPIVHKFGIISHTQRLELQERLLKQTYMHTLKSQRVIAPSRNPLEVTEEFVQQYNTAASLDEKEHYEETAHKMLARAKRRAGLRNGGSGNHVNLPMAWTELAQLAQCQGKIQEECLDVLITSLDQSPLEKYHIPALFFLAETMLYWLRTDAVHQPYLRTGEIKLLRMGQLVFARLFYHHMVGQLQGQQEFKNRLFTYLEGLSECQEAYSPYPNALLSMRFIITVGKIIMSDTQLEPGEIKEGDNIKKTNLSRPSVYHRPQSSPNNRKEGASQRDQGIHTSHSGALSSSVHDLSPTLWHALDVWRCTNHLSGGLLDALKALSHCGMGLVNENWVDSMVALQILAEAAKSSITAMRTLHNMARGFRPRETTHSPAVSSQSESSDVQDKKDTDIYSFSSEDSPIQEKESRASVASSKPTLSDIYERSEEGDSDKRIKSSNKTATLEGSSKHNKEGTNTSPSKSGTIGSFGREEEDTEEIVNRFADMQGQETQSKPGQDDPSFINRREVSFDAAVFDKPEKSATELGLRSSSKSPVKSRLQTQDSRKTMTSFDSSYPPGTGWKASAGTDLPSGRASDASTILTFTNAPNPDTPGINGWHWEVAITYTDILADICLHGSTADIQRMALLGVNREITDPFKRGFTSVPLPSAGLLDLAFFKVMNEPRDGGPNDWSWRIRFGAVQSMVKICRCLANDKNREGMRTAAWSVLLRAHSMEKDDRVLEALKVGQVHTDMESLLKKELFAIPYTLGSKIAAGLSTIYLPPLPPPVDPYVPVRRREPTPTHKSVTSPPPETSREKKQFRTSLKEEIMLATALYEPPVNFNTRTSFDLRRIVEDQWRKDLQKQVEDEEADRQAMLMKKQEEEEELQKQIAEAKARKLNKQKSPAKE